ncbi:hypothetical protein EBME_0685 [bacterium endosymbiont of Mortierella elongata FMR23-6]|nr:hypothetical protein EBME_0685 [bacterium endosymbiont of Mortierella elongata FMR23-6]
MNPPEQAIECCVAGFLGEDRIKARRPRFLKTLPLLTTHAKNASVIAIGKSI